MNVQNGRPPAGDGRSKEHRARVRPVFASIIPQFFIKINSSAARKRGTLATPNHRGAGW